MTRQTVPPAPTHCVYCDRKLKHNEATHLEGGICEKCEREILTNDPSILGPDA